MLRLKYAHDQIQSILSLREEMANAVVHDLRNPLTAILLANSGLQALELPVQAKKKVERISSATNRLKNLVDNILVLSKIEAGKLSLSLATVDLVELLQQVIDDLQAIAEAKQIHFIQDLPQFAINLSGDRELLRRALDNLLANALKFSPPKSEIIVSIKAQTDNLEIAIADQGAGISPTQKQAIFQKYASYDISRSVVAIGLGLSFCKTVIEAHGGNISVRDNRPKGTIFIVDLPWQSQ